MTARRTLTAAVCLALAAVACRTNRCKDGTLFLTVTIEGTATAADELRVDVTTEGQPARSKTFARTSGAGGGTIQIDYPDGYPTGKTSVVVVTASAFNMIIATGTVTVTLGNGCSTAGVTLAANGDGGVPSCTAGGACMPASMPDACAVYTVACSTGVPVCQRSGLRPPGTSCSTGVCSMAGACVACEDGSDCMPADDACKVGALACATGAPVCNATAVNRADGHTCGTNKVCRAGACVDCLANHACMPPAGACVSGVTSCTSGTSVCLPTTPVGAGQSCGTNMVCNGGGSCVACPQGSACTPTVNACRVGMLDCGTGAPVCMETAGAQPDGLTCAIDRLCAGGSCASAGNWITRGEDARTSTGGHVYAYTFGGATLEPATTPNVTFMPSPGGVTGRALAVMGTVPPENPAMNLTTGAGLAFNLTTTGGPLDAAARGSGVQFQVKSAQAIMLKVKAVDIWTDEMFPNCSMDAAATVVHRCYQYPQVTCAVPGGNVWTRCRFAWSDFKRPPWGTMGDNLPLDPSAMTDMQFQTPTVMMGAAPLVYSFAIDDVAFVP